MMSNMVIIGIVMLRQWWFYCEETMILLRES